MRERRGEREAWTKYFEGNTAPANASKAKGASKPKIPSRGEQAFELHCQVKLHPVNQPVREHVFHPTRKWRIDFAWPHIKLAVEIESSVHRIKSRFASDIPKYNELQKRGWVLLRYTRQMVESGTAINDVIEVMGIL
jgi:very-short-patch-repair endonuclease